MQEDDLVAATDLAGRALELIGGDGEMSGLRLLVGSNRFAWLADQDRFAEAEAGARQVLAQAERSWTPRMGSIRLRVAEMAYVRGHWDDAQSELEQSAEFPTARLITAVRLSYQALIAAHRDDWESAAAHFEALAAPEYLAEALQVYAGLGAVWDTRRALARIRPYGVRPGVRGARRRPKNGWEALTDTEARIAELVSRGLSNPDIAGQLQLSRRTVGNHVSHILMKLQVSSRREVADLARSAASAADARAGVPRRAAG